MIDARAIAVALGGQVAGINTILCPGPGHSPRDRSLAVRINPNAPDGFLVFSHAGDDWRKCRDYVRQRLGLPAWQPGDGRQRRVPDRYVAKWDLSAIESEMEDIPPPWTEDELARIAGAQGLWNESVDPRGTLGETYLRERRGLDLPEDLVHTVLRFHAKCPWRDENTGNTIHVPALVVPFRSIGDDAITAIQRIALNPDGSKLGRRMLGIVRRAAVKLDPATDELVIGEGIETTLAARQLGFKPAWALGSVGAISFFPVIEGVKRLTILGEAGEVSAKAIRICGKRWHGKARRRVRIVMPNEGYSDLNDVLIAEKGGVVINVHDFEWYDDVEDRPRFKLTRFNNVSLNTSPAYLVKGVIPSGGLTVVWGPPKCGKSFWTFDLTMHVARGIPYRGRRVQQGAIAYVSLEGGTGFHRRIQAYKQKHEVTDAPFYLITDRTDLVRDKETLVAAIKEQMQETPAGIIDTLNRSLAGSESSDEDMAAYIKAADAIREAFDCALVIIHHCGMDGSRPRGHTSLTGAVTRRLPFPVTRTPTYSSARSSG